MKPILEGIRVLDWSVYQVGPMAAAFLADLGADVIHVEMPGQGDYMRGVISSWGVSPVLPHGRNAHFEEHNRNKRGIAIDLKTPEGREIMHRLAAKCDVFVSNIRRKAREALDLDCESVRRYNPNIIYASATGLGEEGPYSGLPSIDGIAQAWSGAFTTGVPPESEPCWGVPNVGDRATALQLAYGVLAALLGRERHGEGQEVQVSQLGTMINMQGYLVILSLLKGEHVTMRERTNPRNPLYNFYKCKDGTWVILGGFMADFWPGLCRVLGFPQEVASSPKYQDIPSREVHARELVEMIDEVLATKTRAEWVEVFKEADLLFAPVHTLPEVIDDVQVVANEYVTHWDHPALGRIRFVGHPLKLSKSPLEFRRPAPELGEHNEEVLLEDLGYTWDDIVEFQKKGVFGRD